jgi:uncharacterized YigZ family protein
MNKSYPIAAATTVVETVVLRSRFICYLAPCISTEEARQQVKHYQKKHPQASHHCYAYLSGAPDDSQHYGFSDDGEPSGTAGKPMLTMLQGGGIGEVCAVVVRYFGGTKLGTGGLQRAYGSSVRNALEQLTTKIKIPMVAKRLACQYMQVNDILHLLAQVKGEVISQEYGEHVEFTLSLPYAELASFSEKLQTLSAGQLSLKKC